MGIVTVDSDGRKFHLLRHREVSLIYKMYICFNHLKKCIYLIVHNVHFEDRDKCPPPPTNQANVICSHKNKYLITRYETVVQAQLEPGGGGGTHCGYGFRHVPASLRT